MKTISKIFILILVSLVSPVISYAASLTATQTSNGVIGNAFVAQYSVAQPPAATTKVYLWVGEYDKTPAAWITQSQIIATLPTTTNGYPKTFPAQMDFSTLGVVAGTKYAYTIADKASTNGAFYFDVNTAESLSVKCFMTTGAVPCKTPAANLPFDDGSFTLTPLAQQPDAEHAGKFITGFSIAPNGVLTVDVPLILKIYKYTGSTPIFLKQGNLSIPLGSGTIFPTVNDLAAGDYSASLLSGTAQVSADGRWTVVDSSTPGQNPNPSPQPQLPNSPILPGQSNYVGGISISFKPSDQIVNEDSAVIKATISVQLNMPADFQVLSGISPSQISQSFTPILQPVSVNQGLVPGEVRTFSIPFSGLAKGTTYYFVVKNNATGTQSPVWNFTTKGGTTQAPTSAMTVYDTASGPYADPGSFAPVADTISDKGIVPKCSRTQNEAGTIPPEEIRMCSYKDFIQLVTNVIQYALIIIGPIIAVVVMFAGAMILWLNYDSDPTAKIEAQKKKYFGILGRAAIGLGIVLIAWVLVATLIKELGVKPEFVLLDLFNSK